MHLTKIKWRYVLPLVGIVIFMITAFDGMTRDYPCFQFGKDNQLCSILIKSTIATHIPSSILLFKLYEYDVWSYHRIWIAGYDYNLISVIAYILYFLIGVIWNHCLGYTIDKICEKYKKNNNLSLLKH